MPRAAESAGWQRVIDREYPALAFLLVLAIATRFLLLDNQSLWFDEIVSLTLAKQPFGAMLHDLTRTESTPPLYYVLLWVWVRVAGTSAVALRSLSASFGVLTVGVLYYTARVRFSPGAALVAGAFAATSPMLIWYSQETRSYALVTLFVAASLYFLLRLPAGGTRALAGWSITACLALASHYFAVFAVVPEAVYLLYLYRRRLRIAAFALLGPLIVESALLPLAIHQRDYGHTDYIGAIPLATRIVGTLDRFLLGPYGLSELSVVLLGFVVAVGMTVRIARWALPAVRRNALLLAGLALASFVLPLAITPGSFRDRNLIVVLPPLLLVAGVAFVPRTTRPLAVAAGLATAALLLLPTVLAAHRIDLQREDWRGVAALIGAPSTTRAVLAYPRFEYIPLIHYRPDLEPATHGVIRIRELVVVGRPQLDKLRLPPGFTRTGDRSLGSLRILRFQARRVRTIHIAALHLRPLLRLLHGFRSSLHSARQDATLLIERHH